MFLFAETVFKVVNEEHDKLEAKKKTKHQNSITGKSLVLYREPQDFQLPVVFSAAAAVMSNGNLPNLPYHIDTLSSIVIVIIPLDNPGMA